MVQVQPKVCYVIMPFAEEYERTYREAIRPAIDQVKKARGEEWLCYRADDIRVPGSITKEIVNSLYTADIVIADLTGHNPNVFYELGIVHSTRRFTIMIAPEEEQRPIDINMYRVVLYKASDMDKLSEDLARAILDVLSHGKDIANPVLDFAPIHLASVILGLE